MSISSNQIAHRGAINIMGRKRKMKVETDPTELHRVKIAPHRPAVGGFLTHQEAYLFAMNNIPIKPGQDKEAVLKSSISTYHKTRVVPARKCIT